MTELNSDIINKIRKVLAKTSNNPSIEEAQVAMLMAQRMMFENNLSMSDVNISEIKTKEVVDQVISESSRSLWWYQSLAAIIADNFKCYVYIHRSKHYGVTSIKFVGLKNDVESAKHVYLYAIETITYNYQKYIRENSNRMTKGIKNQYIFGFLNGLRDKFLEQVKHNDWGLIIIKDPDVQKVYKDLKIKKGGKRTINVNNNDQDRLNGYRDGKNFQIIAGKLE